MLTGSRTTSSKLRTAKGTLALMSFVFIFLIASLAVGLRTSNAALPLAAGKGCHQGGEDGAVTCTSSSTSTTTVTSSTTTVDSTTTVTSTSDQSGGNSDPVVGPSASDCSALNGIGFQVLAPGTNVTIAFNGNGQMTFTVPSQKAFTWNWYWVPANGQDTNTLGQQVTSAMWASGHGQNFSFFVANLNGQTGLVLQTDYALSQACG